MKLQQKTLTNIALILMLFIIFVLGCDHFSIKGQVFDERGERISGAVVTIERGGTRLGEAKSDRDGKFDVYIEGNDRDNSAKLTVAKEGYYLFEKILSNEEMNTGRKDVILEKY